MNALAEVSEFDDSKEVEESVIDSKEIAEDLKASVEKASELMNSRLSYFNAEMQKASADNALRLQVDAGVYAQSVLELRRVAEQVIALINMR